MIRLPYDTLAPGAALNVAPRVTRARCEDVSAIAGDVMLLFVRERDHVNVWSWLQAKLDSNIDLVKQQHVDRAAVAQEDSNAAGDLAT